MLNEKQEPLNNSSESVIYRLRLGMTKLPREDYERYYLDRYATKEGRVISEYINKASNIIERCTMSEGESLLAETIYDSVTGEPNLVREFDDDGKIRHFIDEKAISELEEIWRKTIKLDDEKIVGDAFPEELKRLTTMYLFEKIAAMDESLGKDPDIEH